MDLQQLLRITFSESHCSLGFLPPTLPHQRRPMVMFKKDRSNTCTEVWELSSSGVGTGSPGDIIATLGWNLGLRGASRRTPRRCGLGNWADDSILTYSTLLGGVHADSMICFQGRADHVEWGLNQVMDLCLLKGFKVKLDYSTDNLFGEETHQTQWRELISSRILTSVEI